MDVDCPFSLSKPDGLQEQLCMTIVTREAAEIAGSGLCMDAEV